MYEQLKREGFLGIAAAANDVGQEPGTVADWCRRGKRGVRLEHVKLGRSMYTSSPALGRFFERVRLAGEARKASVRMAGAGCPAPAEVGSVGLDRNRLERAEARWRYVTGAKA